MSGVFGPTGRAGAPLREVEPERISKTALGAASYSPPSPPLERAPQALEDRVQGAIQEVRATYKTRAKTYTRDARAFVGGLS
jgi:hypothetical protein